MAKSSAWRGSLQKIQAERRALLRRWARLPEVAIGSVSVVRRKCGNPNCHCARNAGHPQTLFLFPGEDGRRRCKLIRQADSARLLEAGAHYREFRASLRKLRALHQREAQILTALLREKAIHYE